jgi:hypothetical protein
MSVCVLVIACPQGVLVTRHASHFIASLDPHPAEDLKGRFQILTSHTGFPILKCEQADRARWVVEDPAGGNPDIEGQTVGAEFSRNQFALQQTAGVYDGSHGVQPRW